MLKKNLVSFEPTTFFLKLTLFLSKTNSYSNRFFFELDSTLWKFFNFFLLNIHYKQAM